MIVRGNIICLEYNYIQFLIIFQNNNEISHWQFVRKFFLVDNISGYKTILNFTDSEAKNDSVLSTLRYMKSLNVM